MTKERIADAILIGTITEPVMKRLEAHLEALDRGITELATRCQCEEDRADELFTQLFDLLDALDELDVIGMLREHFPDHRRYQVDKLAEQVAAIWRRYA